MASTAPLLVLAGLLVTGIAVGTVWHIRTLWNLERAKAEDRLSTVEELKALA